MSPSHIPESITAKLPVMVRQSLAEMTAHGHEAFLDEYRRRSKKVWIAYLCLMFWVHYAYLGRWLLQIAFILTVGGFGIWWIVDVFRLFFVVRDRNRDVAIAVMRDVKITAVTPARPTPSFR